MVDKTGKDKERLAELERNVYNVQTERNRRMLRLEQTRARLAKGLVDDEVEAINNLTKEDNKRQQELKKQSDELQKQYDATQKLIDAEAERVTSLKSALDELIAFSQDYDKKQADASKRLLFVNKPEEDSAEIEAIDALSDRKSVV